MLYLKSLLAALVFPGTATGLVPWALIAWGAARFDIGHGRWAGIAPMAVGLSGLLWCIFDFARIGRGTLATVDPPKVLVLRGLYRWVRNPMYVCVLTTLVGEAVVWQSWAVAAWAAALAVIFHLFVILYEEPRLKRRFGADYEAYLESVPRWIFVGFRKPVRPG